ncbi:hypothetical protein CEXT_296661 [Caerostris extrusa]|uniref:Uncharacterized protein n=1 Tax=Caerostris extrusa TaxID=172846 RepID=A0AAV4R8P9_CAEEX|nr:hypothetical protein CEXT_296661 [Caerostris extrusa]
MNSATLVILLFGLLLAKTCQAATLGDGEIVHGGHGLKEHGVGAKDHEGKGYGVTKVEPRPKVTAEVLALDLATTKAKV